MLKISLMLAFLLGVSPCFAQTAEIEPQKSVSHEAPLDVLEFVLTNHIEGREPKDIVESFNKELDRGFAFARLNVKTPTDVTFLWYRNDKLVTRFSTEVQASEKWRTFSSVKLRPGQWKVQLMAKEKILAEKTFSLE